MITVKILGSGCPNCRKVEEIARQAAKSLGVEAEFIKITDYNEITDYNVLSTPGLVIDEKVVSTGRIPAEVEIVSWLADALEHA